MITKLNIDDDSAVGRLGNKLFIIAAGYSIAKIHKTEFILPEWKYKHFFPNVRTGNIGKINDYYTEKAFTYDKISLNKPINDIISLNGYFQSDKYFYSRDSIIELFDIHNVELPPITYNDYISIHVRRGDYLKVSHVHNNLSLTDYYETAIKLANNNKFIIFSDDIDFCKTYFSRFTDKEFHYMERTTELQDLYAMTLCKGNIIANSSFSWWGAYLNKNSTMTIMPRAWFTNDCIDSKDLYVNGWYLI